jgi:phospholipid/cholesterol/gamma-HCH transport system substrate-binding protein
MPRTPVLERAGSLKVLGAAFIAMMLFFVWLTYAFFTKAFVDSDDVTLLSPTAGVNLPQNADVKLRGMTVGELRAVDADAEGVRMTLAMDPDLIDEVPAGVTAQLVPKTLFGEKYVALIPPESASGESLKAGDTITKANVPIEVETLLNDLYPLLDAVQPAELSYTLTAVATALEGRGEELGETLVTANDYLAKINPDVPMLVDDLVKLGTVSDGYAEVMPEVGRLLENVVVTGNTVVAKRTQLAGFFDEATRLSDTLTDFVSTNGDNLEALAAQGRPILGVSARYSSTFPCFLGGMGNIRERLDSVFRGKGVHIDLEVLGEQPTAFRPSENAVIPSEATIEATPAALPEGGLKKVCAELDQYAEGNGPYDQSDPYPGPSEEVFKIIGVDNSHNGKFGDEDAYNRAAAESLASAGFYEPSLVGTDSAAQRDSLAQLVGASAGVPAADVPDVGSLLIGTVVRGAEVTLP